jgi:hypothetical protein
MHAHVHTGTHYGNHEGIEISASADTQQHNLAESGIVADAPRI